MKLMESEEISQNLSDEGRACEVLRGKSSEI